MNFKQIRTSIVALGIALLLIACGAVPTNDSGSSTGQDGPVSPTEQNNPVSTEQESPVSLTLSEVVDLLRHATYDSSISMGDEDEVVTLTDGRWEGEPYVEGSESRPEAGLIEEFVAMGDLTGDGQDEAVGVLWDSGGGSGTGIYLVVMTLSNQEVKQATITSLGDRVELKSLAVEAGEIALTLVQAGEDEGMCCASEWVDLRYVLEGDQLSESHSEIVVPSLTERLRNGVYSLSTEDDSLTDIQLSDGSWEGEPFVEGSASRPTVILLPIPEQQDSVLYTTGELNGDDMQEVAALLVNDGGGSGSFIYLVVMSEDAQGQLTQVAETFLGDRIQVQSIWITEGQIHLQALTHSADDSLCCPTQQGEFLFTLGEEGLNGPISSTQQDSSTSSQVVDLLRHATYDLSIGFSEQVVTLTDGKWEGEPFVEGGESRPEAGLIDEFVAMGDLTGDGQDEAVAILWDSGGGSGTGIYLVVMTLSNQEAKQAAITSLGDRVELKSLAVEAGEIALTLVQAGEDEGMCCASEWVDLRYVLEGDQLSESHSEVIVPTLNQRLRNGAYSLSTEDNSLTDIQLSDGSWEGEPFVEGSASRPTVTLLSPPEEQDRALYAEGELNEDGMKEVVALLANDGGGSGSFIYLVVMSEDAQGQLTQVAETFLGDRIQVQSIWIDQGQLYLQALAHGPNDSACCPTEEKQFVFTLGQDGLTASSSSD